MSEQEELNWEEPVHNPWAEEDAGEPAEDVEGNPPDEATDQEEEAGEDLEEDEGELEEGTEEEAPTDAFEEKYENMKSAMQAERGKRQEASVVVQQLSEERDHHAQVAQGVQSQLDGVMAQLKELELDALIDLPKAKEVDPRVEKLLQQQQAAEQAQQVDAFYATMAEQVQGSVEGYDNLNTDNDAQGQILSQMITASTLSGMSMEDAVQGSLAALNDMVGGTIEGYKKKREPVVKPRKKIKAATRSKAAPNAKRRAKEQEVGDYKGTFADMAQNMIASRED